MASHKAANEFLSFLDNSPTPWHAVDSVKKRLVKAGFHELKERDAWASSCKPGGKYYLTRNGSTISAFAIGKKWKPGNPVSIIGAHTDSCTLRVKPLSKKQSDGFLQVGVETYGGGLWHTWFDRDLSLAGRAMVRTNNGDYTQKLVKIDRPILRIPTLAIHLDRQETFTFNKETQLFPIAGLVATELNRQERTASAVESQAASSEKKLEAHPTSFKPLKLLEDRHHSHIVELIAVEAGVEPSDVVDFEIVLYDTQHACIGGLNNDLIFSARLDNLGMSYCSTMGLIGSLESSTALDDETSIRISTLFDHEEIGSTTAQGAESNFLPALMRRLSALPSSVDSGSDSSYENVSEIDISTAYEQTLSSSFLISADMSHSVHPNYPAKYESDHRPEMNKGPVLKINANNRYATNSPGIVLIEEIARRCEIPLQMFVVRNDSSCGSTIGPMLAAALGTRTLDLGNPQLSMHSIRETAGVFDVQYGIELFKGFFKNYSELEGKILVD